MPTAGLPARGPPSLFLAARLRVSSARPLQAGNWSTCSTSDRGVASFWFREVGAARVPWSAACVHRALFPRASFKAPQQDHSTAGTNTMEAEEGRDTARAAARAAAEAMPIIPEDNDAQTYVWLAITYFVMEAAAAGRGAVRQAAAAGRGAVRQAAALAEAMNRARRNLVEDYAPYALLLTVFYFVLCVWALKVLEIVGWHFDWALPAVVALLSAVMLLLGMRINDAQAYGLLAITCLATVAWALKVLEIVGWHFDWALPAVVALLSAVMLLLGCHVREVLFLIIWESLCFNGCCAIYAHQLAQRTCRHRRFRSCAGTQCPCGRCSCGRCSCGRCSWRGGAALNTRVSLVFSGVERLLVCVFVSTCSVLCTVVTL